MSGKLLIRRKPALASLGTTPETGLARTFHILFAVIFLLDSLFRLVFDGILQAIATDDATT